jgi:hypothetical protein
MAKTTPRHGVLAEFSSSDALEAAVRWLGEEGYSAMDTFTPYAVEEVEPALGMKRSTLPRWGFAAGGTGAALACGIQWYANAWDYPLNVGGRPLNSLPAWIPIMFETAVLFAALTVFVGFWIQARLPALWHPVFEAEGFERATLDRFWVAVAAGDPRYEPLRTAEALRALGALRVVSIGEG